MDDSIFFLLICNLGSGDRRKIKLSAKSWVRSEVHLLKQKGGEGGRRANNFLSKRQKVSTFFMVTNVSRTKTKILSWGYLSKGGGECGRHLICAIPYRQQGGVRGSIGRLRNLRNFPWLWMCIIDSNICKSQAPWWYSRNIEMIHLLDNPHNGSSSIFGNAKTNLHFVIIWWTLKFKFHGD